MKTRLIVMPPPHSVSLARPDAYQWAGPCKAARCHLARDLTVLVMVGAAIALACSGLGIL